MIYSGIGDGWAPAIPETFRELLVLDEIVPCGFYWIGGSTNQEPGPHPPEFILSSTHFGYDDYIPNDSGISKGISICSKM